MTTESHRVTYLGHATLLLELGGVRLLTDPLLRARVAHLRRRSPPVPVEAYRDIDAVLISHLHLDHLDFPSLESIGRGTRLILPRGAGELARSRGFQLLEEVSPGDTFSIGPLKVRVVESRHHGRRPPRGPQAPALGYILDGNWRIYFPGDTDVFPEMATLASNLDLAFLPVWGWGPNLGDGHLDPKRAAEALAYLKPRMAIPIHWGTFYPLALSWFKPFLLTNPPVSFVKYARSLAPDVEIRILQPGEGMVLGF